MTQSSDRPELLIVGDPNGSGKTTMARRFVRLTGYPYLCADEIAYELSPDNVAAANIQAGREFLTRCGNSINEGKSMIVESTLSGKSFRNVIAQAAGKGYYVSGVFVFVDSADVCLLRVAERVRRGGHHVPAMDIRRRFSRSISNFWNIYRHLADDWVIGYNGQDGVQDIASGVGDAFSISIPKLFQEFIVYCEASEHP